MKRRKFTVEESLVIDVNELARQGFFSPLAPQADFTESFGATSSGVLSGFVMWHRLSRNGNETREIRLSLRPADIPEELDIAFCDCIAHDAWVQNQDSIHAAYHRDARPGRPNRAVSFLNVYGYRFSCPKCLKRVQKLYFPPAPKPEPSKMYRYRGMKKIILSTKKGHHILRFLCRECHNLSYASRQKRRKISEPENFDSAAKKDIPSKGGNNP